jgi:hypothetical protein
MLRALKKWFLDNCSTRSSSPRRNTLTARRVRRFRPALEELEGRLVPASSANVISATLNAQGSEVVFAIAADHTLWEFDPSSFHTSGNYYDRWQIVSYGYFTDVSATQDGQGNAVCFAVRADHTLWEFDPFVFRTSGNYYDRWQIASYGYFD